MKVLLVAVNARYSHTNLAVRYLRNAMKTKNIDTKIYEASTSDGVDAVLPCLYNEKADVYCFSVYIWNIDFILRICRGLRKLMPDCKIILGGPEVSYNPNEIIKQNPFIDYIVCGDGEIVFLKLAKCLKENKEINIEGIVSHSAGGGVLQEADFDNIPFPYLKGEVNALKDKILYFETSRGCPFSCSYCLSGSKGKVRFMPIDGVKEQIHMICSENPKIIKFVDRTFNVDKERARELFKFLSGINANTKFHFEICANLLEDEDFEILKDVPKDKFQFEIGVQSTNTKTLKAISRDDDADKTLNAVKRLYEAGNIHLHLDLIAGLPYEDYASFRDTFNKSFIYANALQLGFLKMLKGSKIISEEKKYGYVFSDCPPYEIYKNDFLSYDEILKLKKIELLLKEYKNSHKFDNALNYIMNYVNLTFDFFEEFSNFIDGRGIIGKISEKTRFALFYDFIKYKFPEKINIFGEYLRLDYVTHNRGAPPFEYNKNSADFKELCGRFFKNEKNIKEYFKGYDEENLKNIHKFCDIFVFNFGYNKVLLFNRQNGTIIDITKSF